MGVELGPSFQGLDNIYYDGNNAAIADLATFNWAAHEGINTVEPHTIHPTTLDALVQLSWVSLTDGCSTKIPTIIPTRIHSAWISNSGLSYPETQSLQIHCTAELKGSQKAEVSSFALDGMGNLRLSLSRLESSMVSDSTTLQEDVQPKQIGWYMSWKPDITFLKSHEVLRFCQTAPAEDVERIKIYQDLEFMSNYFAAKALHTIPAMDQRNAKPYMRKYLESLRRHLKAHQKDPCSGRLLLTTKDVDDDHKMDAIVSGDMKEHPLVRTYLAIGERLPEIISGAANPLEILFSEENLAKLSYQDICVRGTYCKEIAKYLDLLAHQNPGLDVLEVGAGTGSFTECVLPALLQHDGWERCTERIQFRMLNIEGDLVSQGFEEYSFDLILAHSVLHATSNIAHTLQNCHKLLRPGGKLVLLEMAQPDLMRTGFVFGALEGWWLSTEDFRSDGPCISEETWNTILTQNGFTGVDFLIRDTDDPMYHEYSIMVSTANEEDPVPLPIQNIVFLIDLTSSLQQEVVKTIKGYLDPSIKAEIECLSYKDTISIRDAQSYFFVTHRPENTEVAALNELIDGLARVLRSELGKPFVTLHLEDDVTDLTKWGKTVAIVLSKKILDSGASKDMEYVVHDEVLHTGRIREAKALDQEIHTRVHSTTREIRIDQAGAVALTVEKPGLLDSLHFTRDEQFLMEIGPDEIEVKVQYIGLNFRDLLVALSRYHNNDNLLGGECSGVVTRVGVNCKSFTPGDRACVAKFGCVNTYVRSHSDLVFQIPEGMASEEAAGMIITGSTAYHSLINVAKLKPGESILIHAASGATGQMAIQIAKYLGCDIYVTVGFNKKKELLIEQYGIPEDHIFYSRNLSFAKGIRRMTHGRGVDVVLNSLSGDALIASWELIAPYGRFVELGTLDIYTNNKLPMSAFAKNVSFVAIAIDALSVERPKDFREIMLNVIDFFRQGIFHSVRPFQLMPITNFQDAMRLLQGGKISGKIILSVDEADVIPAAIPPRALWSLDPNATYVIAGGLGGLGRSAALWMASKGARHLILLSRSGPVSEAATSLLFKLRGMGVSVEAPKCDITSSDRLRLILSQCLETFPPIKGCIQASMVLKDVLFEKRSFQEWSAAISPKVQGTWNLHKLLPGNLEFFVLLSSIAGVFGSIGQSNYAAGNTFQDAFCLYRKSQGQKAVCLRLGIMSDIGIISENPEIFKNRDLMFETASVRETEFLALLDHYCNPNNQVGPLTPQESLPIIGLLTPSQFLSQGLEVPPWVQTPTFSPLAYIGRGDNVPNIGKSAHIDFRAQLQAAESVAQAKEVVSTAVVMKLAKALGLDMIDIDANKPFHAYGVDSLLAVELRNWFGKELDTTIAVYDIMGAESIVAMSDVVVSNSSLVALREES